MIGGCLLTSNEEELTQSHSLEPSPAAVIHLESLRGLLWYVRRNRDIVRIAECRGMHEAKVRHIEKAFELATCETADIDGRTNNLLVARIVPMRHRRQVGRSTGVQAPGMSRSIRIARPPDT